MSDVQAEQNTARPSAGAPPSQSPPPAAVQPSRMRRAALWVTIGTLIATGVLGGIFIVVGAQSGIMGRAWLTLVVVALFAMAALVDGSSPGPNRWYLATSTLVNVFLLLIALLKLWNGPLQPDDTTYGDVWAAQIGRWMLVVCVARIALFISQLYVLHFITRATDLLSRVAGILTVVFASLTAVVFVIPPSFPNLYPLGLYGYADWWWRIAGATALVTAVSVVIPLVVRVFEPKPPAPPLAAHPAPAPNQSPSPPPWKPPAL